MRNLYHFHPQLLLRTPARPFATPLTAASLEASLHDESFMEALYLASPVVQEECQKWRRGELTDPRRVARLRGAVARYYARFSSRCTPFGLFAGCAVVAWGPGSGITLAPARHARHTRLDMHYLCALAQHLAAHEALRPRLRYRPNSSWYQLGDEIRYIEQHYAQGQRGHQISSLGASPAVAQVLAACAEGCPYAELLALLAPDAAEQPEAAAFLDALIEAQVLVSELEPTVTGPEFLEHLRRVLGRLLAEQPTPALHAITAKLAEVAAGLRALDAAPVNAPAAYQAIMAALAPLGVPLEADKLFQTDAIRGVAPEAATLSAAVQADLLDALEVLAVLTPPAPQPRLAEFTRQFEARYEGREVPLLEVLDTESGLPYSDYGKSSYSPLVHDLDLGAAARPARALQHDEVQQYMYQQLRQAERQGQYAVALDPQELRRFRRPAAAPLPPSLAVVFRPGAAGQLLLDSVGGSSAVNLLGRFAHAAPGIEQVVRDVTAAEQHHNPGVAFAELCHLPASRVGNILRRPAFRALEIPYLAQSGLPAAGQVRVQDLTLRLHQGQLELRSRRTGQRIVPRLSTAHNYAAQALPVYELLADLQTQGLQARLGFSWQSVSLDARFSPRLTCRQVVLEAASWQLEAPELATLLAAPPAGQAAAVRAFRAQWRLPRFFTLADGDNELLVDADNELLVQVWLDTIRGRPSIRLKEFLFDPAASPVRDAAGQAYAAQFIALLVRQGPCYAAAPPPAEVPAAAEETVPRDFQLGSEWLYYKLYCGPSMANRVLREAIAPLVAELQGAGLVDDWFFVRYADPASHLRLRLHLPWVARIGEVVQRVNDYLAPCLAKGYLWKSQTDTYQRELERYGPHTMALAERLFCYQSTALLAYLAGPAEDDALPSDEAAAPDGEEAYWLWGLQAMDELLRAFGCAPAQQLALLRGLHQSFAREFGLDKALRLQLDGKYRRFRPAIERALAAAPAPPPALRALAAGIRAGVAARPGAVSLEHLLGSYLHMLLNRLLPADARLHELVLYDFLARHYQSQAAQQRPAAPALAGQEMLS